MKHLMDRWEIFLEHLEDFSLSLVNPVAKVIVFLPMIALSAGTGWVFGKVMSFFLHAQKAQSQEIALVGVVFAMVVISSSILICLYWKKIGKFPGKELTKVVVPGWQTLVINITFFLFFVIGATL